MSAQYDMTPMTLCDVSVFFLETEPAGKKEGSENREFRSGFSLTMGSLFNVPLSRFPQLENESNFHVLWDTCDKAVQY